MIKKLLISAFIASALISEAQTPTVGLIQSSQQTFEGYTLLAPLMCPSGDCKTYLFDNCGQVVTQWPTTAAPGINAHILPDGRLLRPYLTPTAHVYINGAGGGLQFWDMDGNLLWDYIFEDGKSTLHHEATYMPNGHVLVQAVYLADSATCVANGRDPAFASGPGVMIDEIFELNPIYPDSAEIVWKWDLWDHMIQNFDNTKLNYGQPDQHPELINMNYYGLSNGASDWLHCNAINYNAQYDQIVISSRSLGEFYIIDHSTSTAEASTHTGGTSGKGGDIIYRWGNPEAYGKGTSTDKKLFGQHNVHWIADGLPNAGRMLVFNNGDQRTPAMYTSIDIIDVPSGTYSLNVNGTYDPDTAIWTYAAPNPTDFFSQYIGGAEQLPNGDVLINDGTHGTIFEIDSAKNVVWKYISPVTAAGILSQGDTVPNTFFGTANWLFRAPKYSVNYSAFSGHTFTPVGEIEQNPYPLNCSFVSLKESNESIGIKAFPNPTTGKLTVQSHGETSATEITVINILGETINVNFTQISSNETEVDLSNLPAGTYFLNWKDNNNVNGVFKVIKTN